MGIIRKTKNGTYWWIFAFHEQNLKSRREYVDITRKRRVRGVKNGFPKAAADG
jgi:hypothetical protein